jgi:hypothetical protein
MKCQVGRSPGSVALQGQLLARTRRVLGGTRVRVRCVGGRAIRVGRARGGRAPAPASRDAPMSTSTQALRAPTWRVAGAGLRAGLTGRNRRGACCERGGFGFRACFGGDCCPPCHVLVVKPRPTSTHASRVTAWCVAGAGLRAGLTGRKGLSGWGPGIASRAGGAGLTGRNRRGCVLNEVLRVCGRFAATCAHRPLLRSGSLMPPGAFHGSRSLPFPILACLRSSCVCQQYVFAGPSTCFALLRFPPDCGSGPVGLPALLGFRPVRPAPSAWHEMPGWAFPGLRRPARAALSRNSPCAGWCTCAGTLRGRRSIRVGRDRGGRAPAPASRDAPMSTSIHALRATTRRVAGMGLRAGLTGRKGCWAGVPGLHPGLMELALQAGIAAGRATRPDTSPLTSNARQGARHLWRTMNTRGVDHEWRAVDVNRPVRPRYAAGATLAARARAVTGGLISTACHFCFSAVMERTARQLGGSPMALKFSGTLQKDC